MSAAGSIRSPPDAFAVEGISVAMPAALQDIGDIIVDEIGRSPPVPFRPAAPRVAGGVR